MMSKIHEPIRMCVVCKGRFHQDELLRFSQKSGELSNGANSRSFYVCKDCARKDSKELSKRLSRFTKLDSLKLKEIFFKWLTTSK